MTQDLPTSPNGTGDYDAEPTLHTELALSLSAYHIPPFLHLEAEFGGADLGVYGSFRHGYIVDVPVFMDFVNQMRDDDRDDTYLGAVINAVSEAAALGARYVAFVEGGQIHPGLGYWGPEEDIDVTRNA